MKDERGIVRNAKMLYRVGVLAEKKDPGRKKPLVRLASLVRTFVNSVDEMRTRMERTWARCLLLP